MEQPGRISADALSVTVPPEAALPNAQLAPPPQMGEREAAEWQVITARLGAAWFPKEAHALLTAYCNIKTQLDDLHQALATFGSIPEDQQGWGRYKELTLLRNRLAQSLASLSTKLRLAPSSRTDRHWAGATSRRRVSQPPWAADHDGGSLCG